jgi:ribulose 1,5-bisphosphate synthetase/thiazole synthase
LAASALLCHANPSQETMAEREYIDTDVVIIGAGPAGLTAAYLLT